MIGHGVFLFEWDGELHGLAPGTGANVLSESNGYPVRVNRAREQTDGRTGRNVAAFLVVGLLGFGVDAAAYNFLVFFSWDGWSWSTLAGEGVLFAHPLSAKIAAIGTATLVTYVGNRYWVFTGRRDDGHVRHLFLYAVVNVVAIGLQLACLGFSRYVLKLDSPLADNVSGTLIGQVVAVMFRYWAYDTLVFRRSPGGTGD